MKSKKHFYITLLATTLFIALLWSIDFSIPPKIDSYNEPMKTKFSYLKRSHPRID